MDNKTILENQLTEALSQLKETKEQYKNLENAYLRSEKEANLKSKISEILLRTSDDHLFSEILKFLLDSLTKKELS